MYEHPTGSISKLGYKILQMYIQAMKYTYKVQVNQFQPLHHNFKRLFQVQSLSVLLQSVRSLGKNLCYFYNWCLGMLETGLHGKSKQAM